MNTSPDQERSQDHQRVSDFLVERVGELWGVQESYWRRHLHPDFDKLAPKLLESLRSKFGPELVTRSTASLLCYKGQPQELAWWKDSRMWKEREMRERVGFGCWLWQATYPSDLARDLFMEEFEWETRTLSPDCWHELYLASDVLTSWLGRVPRLHQPVQPIRPTPDPRALDMIESLLRRELTPWPVREPYWPYARYSVILKKAGRFNLDLCRHVLNLSPRIAIDNDVCNDKALDPYLMEVVYEFAAELDEENSHRFCYFSWPTGARWVIRACENVERLGLTTLASRPPDVFDRNHAIRKIAGIKAFLPEDDLKSFKSELSRFSPTTRRLVAGCSPVARSYLLDDPACAQPPAFDVFRDRFLSLNNELHIYFDNSPDPENGVIPVAEFRRLADELGETGRRWMLEEFAQQGGRADHALLLLKGLFGLEREKIEASIARSSQTAIKAYGLLPLPETDPERTNELLARHARMREFAKEAGKFKAGRRTNSLAAVRAGLANLAQSAGFRSPIAMEIEIMLSSCETAEALPRFSHESHEARIVLTGTGPKIMVVKLGRPQKSVPPVLKKLDGFVKLKEKLAVFEAQFQHFAEIFEEKMVSQSAIPADEFSKLFALPVSRWILQRLVLRNGEFVGMMDEDGKSLASTDRSQPLVGDVSIIHPIQLSEQAKAGWTQCIQALGLDVPFPQMERETYAPQDNETTATGSHRFAGISVDCTSAIRKLTRYGWTAAKVDYPFFYKTYPEHGVRASLLPGDSIRGFDSGEDFLIDTFCFSPSGDEYFLHSHPIALGEIPPVVFSEVVRDLQLAFGKK